MVVKMTFQLFYQSGNYFIAHVCKGEIRIKTKGNQITQILFKKTYQSPTITKPNRTSTMQYEYAHEQVKLIKEREIKLCRKFKKPPPPLPLFKLSVYIFILNKSSLLFNLRGTIPCHERVCYFLVFATVYCE
jgi:hypothetical protein